MKRNFSTVKNIVMKQILLAGELKEFKISDELTVFADSLEQDMVVFDVDNNALANTEFVFEGKTYKTGENGEIVSVEEAKEEEKPETEAQVDAAEEPATADATATETPAVDTAKLQEELDAANKKVEDLEVENQALKAELSTVKEEAMNLSAQPRTDGKDVIDVMPIKFEDMTPFQQYRYQKENL